MALAEYRIGTLLALLASVTLARAQPIEQPSPAQNAIQSVGIDQKLDQQLPLDLTFRDETAQPVSLGRYFSDRPVVLTLVYYNCPSLCNMVLNGMVKSLGAISFSAGKEFEVVVVSFDPTEKPDLAAAKKSSYIKAYGRPGAASGWHFLTGDEPNIRKLAAAAGFRYAWDERSKQYAHAASIMLLTPQGKISRYFYGLEYAPNDLRLGLVEASQNRIGDPTDRLLLLCFHYDPATGRYGVVIINILRLLAVVTLAALGWLLIAMVRRERPPRRSGRQEVGNEPDTPMAPPRAVQAAPPAGKEAQE